MVHASDMSSLDGVEGELLLISIRDIHYVAIDRGDIPNRTILSLDLTLLLDMAFIIASKYGQSLRPHLLV